MKESDDTEEFSFFSYNYEGCYQNIIYLHYVSIWEHAAFTLKVKIKHTFLEKVFT